MVCFCAWLYVVVRAWLHVVARGGYVWICILSRILEQPLSSFGSLFRHWHGNDSTLYVWMYGCVYAALGSVLVPFLIDFVILDLPFSFLLFQSFRDVGGCGAGELRILLG